MRRVIVENKARRSTCRSKCAAHLVRILIRRNSEGGDWDRSLLFISVPYTMPVVTRFLIHGLVKHENLLTNNSWHRIDVFSGGQRSGMGRRTFFGTWGIPDLVVSDTPRLLYVVYTEQRRQWKGDLIGFQHKHSLPVFCWMPSLRP